MLSPSHKPLRARLHNRFQVNATVIERRMRDAVSEMSHYDEYDYLIINDDFQVARDELTAIVLSRRLRLPVQVGRQAGLLAGLLASEQ